MKLRNRSFGLLFCITILIAMISMPVSSEERDSQFWGSAITKAWQSQDKKSKLFLYGEFRENNNMRSRSGSFVGPMIRHKINDNVAIGAGIKFIDVRDIYGTHKYSRRYEAEITPSTALTLADRIYKFSLRNRLEFIGGSNDKEKTRYRHRLKVSNKVPENSYIDSFFMSQEYIYVTSGIDSKLDQTRMIPLGVKLRVDPKYSVTVFYMINRKMNSPGKTNNVLGIGVSF